MVEPIIISSINVMEIGYIAMARDGNLIVYRQNMSGVNSDAQNQGL